MIYLYHGTDLEFDTPIPERGRKGTDFGQGFYLTPHLESAVNMAHRVARRKNSLESVVMCLFARRESAGIGGASHPQFSQH